MAKRCFCVVQKQKGVADAMIEAPFFVGKSRILRPPLVNKDLEEGISFGVPVIPTFFINGRLMVGAQPLQSVGFQEQAAEHVRE